MIDRVRPWRDLHAAQKAMRAIEPSVSGELRRLLRKLADAGHCPASTPHRFSDARTSGVVEWGLGGPFDLEGLPELPKAALTLLLKSDRRQRHLHQFTAAIEGTRADGTGWLAAVHLDNDLKDDQMGGGACSHASFHCHVGPTYADRPETRVPFPAVGPVAAVDWLLSQVVPGWEPAPWSVISTASTTAGPRR